MATLKLKLKISPSCEIIVDAEIIGKIEGILEVDNLQTNGDIYLGKGEGNGGHIELYRGDTNFPSIITAAEGLTEATEVITPNQTGTLALEP